MKDNDFGFTFEFHEEGDTPLEELNALVTFKNQRLDELRGMIMPFLMKLANSKGDIIKWPDREKQVTEFMNRIDAFTDNAIARKKGVSIDGKE